MQVQDHVVATAPVGQTLNGGPTHNQVDHDDDTAQLFGQFSTLVYVFHGSGSDVEVRAFDLAGGGTGFVNAVHNVQKAVAPMHKGLGVDVLVVLHEVQATFEPFVDHATVVAPR